MYMYALTETSGEETNWRNIIALENKHKKIENIRCKIETNRKTTGEVEMIYVCNKKHY